MMEIRNINIAQGQNNKYVLLSYVKRTLFLIDEDWENTFSRSIAANQVSEAVTILTVPIRIHSFYNKWILPFVVGKPISLLSAKIHLRLQALYKLNLMGDHHPSMLYVFGDDTNVCISSWEVLLQLTYCLGGVRGQFQEHSLGPS